jgi:2,3-bisphosphoglycerate-dependent phosphoglycerate mutase
MSKLVLVRHGLSEYNEKGLWAGWADPMLTPKGREEAKKTAGALTDITFDAAYTAILRRTTETLEEMIPFLSVNNIEKISDKALNERNYGDFTGKNKWQVKKEIGEEEFNKLRRSWDYPVPNGESLKQVFERVVPYYTTVIEPKLKEGKNVLIVSSGNSLRALVKHLEKIADEDISTLEIGTGEALVYEIDKEGSVVNKETRATNPNKV